VSLKENLQGVREELSSEEKFFESAVKTERFVKRYKNPLIMTVIGIILLVAGMALYEANKSAKLDEANTAFLTLQSNPSDSQAAAQLQQLAPKLYDAWRFSQAMSSKDVKTLRELAASKTPVVSDLAAYEAAVAGADIKALEKYAADEQSIYRDLALFESAVILMEKNQIDAAHQKLRAISQNSPVYEPAQTLLHYGVK
jgi:hypothetical protein